MTNPIDQKLEDAIHRVQEARRLVRDATEYLRSAQEKLKRLEWEADIIIDEWMRARKTINEEDL
jgi:exonuclease VII small subunit